jgi:uncharacterized protein
MLGTFNILATVILGLVAGLIGGSLGQSGAEFMLPGLLILGIVPDFKTAAGTVLLTIIPPISILAVYDYYKRKQLNIPIALIMMVCYFLAAYFGAHFTKNFASKTLEYMCGTYFLILALFFYWNAYTGTFGAAT